MKAWNLLMKSKRACTTARDRWENEKENCVSNGNVIIAIKLYRLWKNRGW